MKHIRVMLGKHCLFEPARHLGWLAFFLLSIAAARISYTEYVILHVYVFSQFRGNRYAEDIETIALRQLHTKGIKLVQLLSRPYNTPALKTYQRLGFSTIGKKFHVRFQGKKIPRVTVI